MSAHPAIAFLSRHSAAVGESIEVHAAEHGLLAVTVERLGRERTKVMDAAFLVARDARPPAGAAGWPVDRPLEWPVAGRIPLDRRFRGGLHVLVASNARGEATEQPFVVVDPAPEVLTVLPAMTWHLYNFWGGRSRYYGPERPFGMSIAAPVPSHRSFARRLIPRPVRQFIRSRVGGDPLKPAFVTQPLTTRRPFAMRPLGVSPTEPFCSHLAASDWRLCAWLEREGMTSGYCTERDLPAVLASSRPRAIILGTHAEYWPRSAFLALEEAHCARGSWLVNLGANAIYEQAEFVTDTETTCMRSRFRTTVGDEARLTGVRYQSGGFATAAPFAVVDRRHWITQGISADGTFGRDCLVGAAEPPPDGYDPELPAVNGRHVRIEGLGASGWELDRKAARGFRVLARGLNPGGGAEMSFREPSGRRGGSFSASSLTFIGSLLVDRGASMVTKRVLERATA